MNMQTQHHVLRRETDVVRIASPLVQQLNAYWLEKCHGRAMPSWSDVDPCEIGRLLPNLIVAGIEHDPLRIFYRLAGTQIVEFRGEITGHYLGAIAWSSDAAQANSRASYLRVIKSRAPIFAEVDIMTRAGAMHRMFAGVWPLAPAPDAPIDRCLALEDYGALTAAELA